MNITLAEIVEQLRACGYECEAGRLEFNTHFQALVELAEHEREVVSELAAISPQTPAQFLAVEERRYCARCGVVFLNVEGDCPVCYYRLMAGRYGRRMGELLEAIRKHRSQKADDRCIEDDDELYAVLHDGIKCDRRVGDKEAMLENCRRFIERRCEGGGWPTYATLEAQVEKSKLAIKHVLDRIREDEGTRRHLGFGTQSFALLTEAAAEMFGQPVGQVRDHFSLVDD